MTVTLYEFRSVPVVSVSGALDTAAARHSAEVLRSVVHSWRPVVLDLNAITIADREAEPVLARACRDAVASGRHLCVVAGNCRCSSLVECVEQVAFVAPHLTAAIQRLQPKPLDHYV